MACQAMKTTNHAIQRLRERFPITRGLPYCRCVSLLETVVTLGKPQARKRIARALGGHRSDSEGYRLRLDTLDIVAVYNRPSNAIVTCMTPDMWRNSIKQWLNRRTQRRGL